MSNSSSETAKTAARSLTRFHSRRALPRVLGRMASGGASCSPVEWHALLHTPPREARASRHCDVQPRTTLSRFSTVLLDCFLRASAAGGEWKLHCAGCSRVPHPPLPTRGLPPAVSLSLDLSISRTLYLSLPRFLLTHSRTPRSQLSFKNVKDRARST